ncbi:hypothetical protein [Moorena bouillonii]|nr:hypothetical protein [Moorena bouillonii]
MMYTVFFPYSLFTAPCSLLPAPCSLKNVPDLIDKRYILKQLTRVTKLLN